MLAPEHAKEAKALKKNVTEFLEDTYKIVWKQYDTVKTNVIEMEHEQKAQHLPLADEKRLHEKRRKMHELQSMLKHLGKHFKEAEHASAEKIYAHREYYHRLMNTTLPHELPKEIQQRVAVEQSVKPFADLMMVTIVVSSIAIWRYYGEVLFGIFLIIMLTFYITYVHQMRWQKRLAEI